MISLTTKITRLPPRDLDLRKRPIGNSGAFFCSSCFCSSVLRNTVGVTRATNQPVAARATDPYTIADDCRRSQDDVRSTLRSSMAVRGKAVDQIQYLLYPPKIRESCGSHLGVASRRSEPLLRRFWCRNVVHLLSGQMENRRHSLLPHCDDEQLIGRISLSAVLMR